MVLNLVKVYSDLDHEPNEGDHKMISEVSQKDAPDWIRYIFLKLRLLQAKVNKSIGMNHVAHEICFSIIGYVRSFKDLEPKKFWLQAVKAAQVCST